MSEDRRCSIDFSLCLVTPATRAIDRHRLKSMLHLPPSAFCFLLLGKSGTKSQREGLMVRIVCDDAGSLAYVPFVPIGLGHFEGHGADLAGGDDLVILAARAAAGSTDTLDLQIDLPLVLDFKSVDERSTRLHRTERMLEGPDG